MALVPRNKIFKQAQASESTGFVFWQVSMLWQRAIVKALAPLGLTHAQFVLLASTGWLTRSGETGISQTNLAAHAQTDLMMTSKVVRTLVTKGLVTRQDHPTDSRAYQLALTPAGRDLLFKAIRVVEATDDAFFAPLGSSQQQFLGNLLTLVNKDA